MYNYFEGVISEIAVDRIVVDVNGVGYELLVSHPNDFHLGSTTKVYAYLQVKEDEFALFGFATKEEKRLFLRLISVSGIGPKTAINLLAKTSTDNMIQAIETSNTSYLKKLPGIGPKAAQQIILDLKGKLVYDQAKTSSQNDAVLSDVKAALKGLGFKASAIDTVLASLVKENLVTEEEYLRRALQLLRR